MWKLFLGNGQKITSTEDEEKALPGKNRMAKKNKRMIRARNCPIEKYRRIVLTALPHIEVLCWPRCPIHVEKYYVDCVAPYISMVLTVLPHGEVLCWPCCPIEKYGVDPGPIGMIVDKYRQAFLRFTFVPNLLQMLVTKTYASDNALTAVFGALLYFSGWLF